MGMRQSDKRAAQQLYDAANHAPLVKWTKGFDQVRADISVSATGHKTGGWKRNVVAEYITADYTPDRNHTRILRQPGLDAAFYDTGSDLVHIPPESSFHEAERWYGTLFHELAHSTGAPWRLGRFPESLENLQSSERAYEEGVAETAATLLLARCGIEPDYPLHARYIRSFADHRDTAPSIFLAEVMKDAVKAADLVCGDMEA